MLDDLLCFFVLFQQGKSKPDIREEKSENTATESHITKMISLCNCKCLLLTRSPNQTFSNHFTSKTPRCDRERCVSGDIRYGNPLVCALLQTVNLLLFCVPSGLRPCCKHIRSSEHCCYTKLDWKSCEFYNLFEYHKITHTPASPLLNFFVPENKETHHLYFNYKWDSVIIDIHMIEV